VFWLRTIKDDYGYWFLTVGVPS
jgi:hypothetical protein